MDLIYLWKILLIRKSITFQTNVYRTPIYIITVKNTFKIFGTVKIFELSEEYKI